MHLEPPNRPHQVYSLWLIPENPAFQIYNATISGLSVTLGGPDFEPHLTLLGGLEGDLDILVNRTKKVAQKILPVQISLFKAGYEKQYYKSLYLEAIKSPRLLRGHETAKTVFEIENDLKYHPHLSLAYGIDNQESIAAGLDESLFLEIEARKLVLISTKGEVKDWKEVIAVEI